MIKKSNGTGLFENFSENTKMAILNQVDDLCKKYKFPLVSQELRKSFGLRLWSGCLSAAKTIAHETMDGPNTPESRLTIFQNLDNIASNDPIFRLGIECATLFKKCYRQYYSFNGVPLMSSVRKYPNEYLVNINLKT